MPTSPALSGFTIWIFDILQGQVNAIINRNDVRNGTFSYLFKNAWSCLTKERVKKLNLWFNCSGVTNYALYMNDEIIIYTCSHT